jgi:hypothetical protein
LKKSLARRLQVAKLAGAHLFIVCSGHFERLKGGLFAIQSASNCFPQPFQSIFPSLEDKGWSENQGDSALLRNLPVNGPQVKRVG